MNDAHLFDFRSYVKCDNDVIDLRTHCATGEGGRVPQTMIESRVLMCFLILLQSEFQFLLMAFVPSDRAGYRAHRLIKKKSRREKNENASADDSVVRLIGWSIGRTVECFIG